MLDFFFFIISFPKTFIPVELSKKVKLRPNYKAVKMGAWDERLKYAQNGENSCKKGIVKIIQGLVLCKDQNLKLLICRFQGKIWLINNWLDVNFLQTF